jgi:hypothetical protein
VLLIPTGYLYVKRSFGVTALVPWLVLVVTVTSTVPAASGGDVATITQ